MRWIALAAVLILCGCQTQIQRPAPAKVPVALPPLPKAPVFREALVSPGPAPGPATVAISWTNAVPVQLFTSTDLLTWTNTGTYTSSPAVFPQEQLRFFKAQSAAAGSVTLAWNETDPTAWGFNVYFGMAHRSYTNVVDVGDKLTAQLGNLVRGSTYFFTVTAYNGAGLESDYSNEIQFTPPPAQWIPLGITVP